MKCKGAEFAAQADAPNGERRGPRKVVEEPGGREVACVLCDGVELLERGIELGSLAATWQGAKRTTARVRVRPPADAR